MSIEIQFLRMEDFRFARRRVLVRVDINAPVKDGRLGDDTRMREVLPTLKDPLLSGAKVVLIAHQGRPGDADFIGLEQHALRLTELLGREVRFADDLFGPAALRAIGRLKAGEVLLLENARFFSGEMLERAPEEHARSALVTRLAPHFRYFINDAFGACHRSQASLVGFTHVLPTCAGRLMERELSALRRVFSEPKRPVLYLMGGVKFDDSVKTVGHILSSNIVDRVLISGFVGVVFLAAQGRDIGSANRRFLEEKGSPGTVEAIRGLLERFDGRILVPSDLAVSRDGRREEVPVSALPSPYPAWDIGPDTVMRFGEEIRGAGTVVFSGPPGRFEVDGFDAGTRGILDALGSSGAYRITGGGHSVAALARFNAREKVDYISTGGGALTAFFAGEPLPVVDALGAAAGRAGRKK